MGHPFATHHNFSPLLQAIGNTIIISLLESLFLALDLLIVLWLLRRFHFAAPINLYRITFLAYVWLFTSTIWIFLQSFKQPKYETIDNQTFAMLALSMPDALDKFLFIREYISDFVINNVKYWL